MQALRKQVDPDRICSPLRRVLQQEQQAQVLLASLILAEAQGQAQRQLPRLLVLVEQGVVAQELATTMQVAQGLVTTEVLVAPAAAVAMPQCCCVWWTTCCW
jgi:hypothetical protein